MIRFRGPGVEQTIRLFLGLTFLIAPLWASADLCEFGLHPVRALTLISMEKLARVEIAEQNKITPPRQYDYQGREVDREMPGVMAPLALAEHMGSGMTAVATPAPFTAIDTAVHDLKGKRSFAGHVDVEQGGRQTSTAIYITSPQPFAATKDGAFIDAESNPVLFLYLPGGESIEATGKAGTNFGEQLEKLNVATMSLDLVGHGLATYKWDGFNSSEKWAEWLMKIVAKVVDPKVKIILGGHSLGAQIVSYIHRHSNDPRFAQIVEYIALAPPVDVSRGREEDLRNKVTSRTEYKQNFPQYKDKIAAPDYCYLEGEHSHAKERVIPCTSVRGMEWDFLLPPLSPEQANKLRPLKAMVPIHDGLVHVSKEDAFKDNFGWMEKATNGSELIMMDYAHSRKAPEGGDPEMVSHVGMFGVLVPGELNRYVVYENIAKWVLAYAPGNEVKLQPHADKAAEVMDDVAMAWFTDFSFRELVKNFEVYNATDTTVQRQLATDRRALEDYAKTLNARSTSAQKAQNNELASEFNKALEQNGLKKDTTLERARFEQKLQPLTEDRRKVLQTYISKIEQLESDLHQGRTDSPEAAAKAAVIREEYASLVEATGIGNIYNYKAKLQELNKRGKSMTPEEKKQAASLSTLERRLKEVADLRKAAKQKLEKLIDLPAGIENIAQANWEISDLRGPERTAKLAQVLAAYEPVEASILKKYQDEADQQFAADKKPDGINSPADIDRRREELVQRATYAYVPPGHPEIAEVAKAIATLTEESRLYSNGTDSQPALPKIELATRDAQKVRADLFKEWASTWEKNTVSSDALAELGTSAEEAHRAYAGTQTAFEAALLEHHFSLYRTGNDDEQHIINLPADLQAQQDKGIAQQKRMFDLRDKVEKERWTEALGGHLTGDPADVAKLTKLAHDLYGQSYPEASADSAIARVVAEENAIEEKRERDSVVTQSVNRLKFLYAKMMRDAGETAPETFEKIAAAELLALPKAELMAELRASPAKLQALQSMVSMFRGFVRQRNFRLQLRDDMAQ